MEERERATLPEGGEEAGVIARLGVLL